MGKTADPLRIAAIKAMRASGHTLAAIAATLGISQPAVSRLLARHSQAFRFEKQMKAHLRAAGYRYCCHCKLWFLATEFPRGNRRCKVCNRQSGKNWLNTGNREKANAKTAQWRKANKDRVNAYQRKYYADKSKPQN